jgi:hypothetical protein
MKKEQVTTETESVEMDFGVARKFAEQAYRHGSQACYNAVMCGLELCRLHDEHDIHAGRPKNNCASSGTITNWDALIEREVGIPHNTAQHWMSLSNRLLPEIRKAAGLPEHETENEACKGLRENTEIESFEKGVAALTEGKTQAEVVREFLAPRWNDSDAERLSMLKRVAAGEAVIWSFRGQERTTGGTEMATKKAKDFLKTIEAGKTTPGRAWAGLAGCLATITTPRHHMDVYKNLDRAVGTLDEKFKGWRDLDEAEQLLIREKIEKALLKIAPKDSSIVEKAILALAELRICFQQYNKLTKDAQHKMRGVAGSLQDFLPSLDESKDFHREWKKQKPGRQ